MAPLVARSGALRCAPPPRAQWLVNSGHLVPTNQPRVALAMLKQFLDGATPFVGPDPADLDPKAPTGGR